MANLTKPAKLGPATSQVGRCWWCGCWLRGASAEAGKCPKCARRFDPKDRSTMNFGPMMGGFGRWMVRPVSGSVVMLGVVGALLILWVSRWPVGGALPGGVGGAWPWFSDLLYYFRPLRLEWRELLGQCRERLREVGWEGAMYMAGVALWALVLPWWWLGTAVRWVGIWRYRPPEFLKGSDRRRQWVFCVALLVVVLGAGVGWPYRMGRLWARDRANAAGPTTRPVEVKAFLERDDSLRVAGLRSAARYAPTARQRLMAIGELVESHGPEHVEWLIEAEAKEKDIGNRALLLRLMGMCRKAEAGEVLEVRLGDPLAEIRAAAADGLGCLHGAAYAAGVETLGDPRIRVGRLISGWDAEAREERVAMPGGRRKQLTDMMTGGASVEEREAAARALVACPKRGYRLRVAQWGVWVSQGAQVPAAIPPFVHETGDSAARAGAMLMDKPVIHLTVSAAMAVDVEVGIRGGRAAHVYPKPDQGKGYPWLAPTEVSSAAARWQSLIVSPSKLSWMKERRVEADEVAGWWGRLREVGGSWVSSGGESERFLYCDGSSASGLGVKFKLTGESLEWTPAAQQVFGSGVYDGVVVRVRGRRVEGFEWVKVPMQGQGGPKVLRLKGGVNGKAVVEFTEALRGLGLTESEAAGMLDCWRREWFAADGERLLMFLKPEDYNRLCPIRVWPRPTEVVRVGVVWVEF